MNRRRFIHSTTLAGTGLSTTLPLRWGKPIASTSKHGFQLLIFATNWGFNGSMQVFAKKIKDEGYDGAELWYPDDEKQRNEILEIFNKLDLKLGFLVGGHANEFDLHFQQFQKNLSAAVEFKPIYINCHSGRDYFTSDQNASFIKTSIQLMQESGMPIYHETHRSRILFAAPVAMEYLNKFPDLRLTLDISHWCNVHESLLQNQKATIDTVLEHSDHIHSRIGHPEGPQVTDPRAPEWEECAEAHFGWWDTIVARKKDRGEILTILTEFGPPHYLPTVPYTKQPLANQWEINKYMLDTLRARYQ